MRTAKKVVGYSIYILIILVLALAVKILVFQRTVVEGASMEGTLHDGDSLLVEKLSYRFSDPERFDIVVFPYSGEKGVYFVKRIIGLPGETVEIREGVLLIDSKVLPYRYNRDRIMNAGLVSTEITLHDNEYFVMGDNVNDSVDSRSPEVGNVDRDFIIGKVFLRVSPFDRFGLVK
ncbi:MAG: signal peptidase I [Lachnospiraceae bacterium]|nr:signal peptidase I [Lachnospiraceae bacterium]